MKFNINIQNLKKPLLEQLPPDFYKDIKDIKLKKGNKAINRNITVNRTTSATNNPWQKYFPDMSKKGGAYRPEKWLRKAFWRIREHDDVITDVSNKTGLSKAFIYGTIMSETGGKLKKQGGVIAKWPAPDAPWQKRAQGIMQVYWKLARSAARRGVISQEDYKSGRWRFDPKLNILIGAEYIARQKKRFLSENPLLTNPKYKKSWAFETKGQAKKRADIVRNLNNEQIENLLHVAYSHGPHEGLVKSLIYKGMPYLRRVHRDLKAKYKTSVASGEYARMGKEEQRKMKKKLVAYTYPLKSAKTKIMLTSIADEEGVDYVEPTGVATPSQIETEDSDTAKTRYVILSGNSHMQGYGRYIENQYREASKKHGINYKIVRIEAPYGTGGQMFTNRGNPGLLEKIKALKSSLPKDADIAAIIHGGIPPSVNKKWNKQLEKLLNSYIELTPNITFIGSPAPRQGVDAKFEEKRFKRNSDVNSFLKERGIKYIDVYNLSSDELFPDEHYRGKIHLNPSGYNLLYNTISSEVGLDDAIGSSSWAEDIPDSTQQIKDTDQITYEVEPVEIPHVPIKRSPTLKPHEDHLDYHDPAAEDLPTGVKHYLQPWRRSTGALFGGPNDVPRIKPDIDRVTSGGRFRPSSTHRWSAEKSKAAKHYLSGLEKRSKAQQKMLQWLKESKSKKTIKLNIIKENVKNLLQEQQPQLVKVDIAIKYGQDFSFYGNVINQIKSIKGVAVARASDIGVVDMGLDKKMVLIHVKFMPDRPLYQYLTYLQIELKKIKDKDGDRIITTQIKGIPKEIEI